MKRGIVISLVLSAALAVLGAACSQTANSNANVAMNRKAMPSNMSNMPMNDNANMSGMDMKSSPNAASQPYDLQFIDTMTMHHQGAVKMAEAALKKTSNDELKKFAQKIIEDQNKEIAR